MSWVSSARSARSGATITERSGRLTYWLVTAASRESGLLYSCTAAGLRLRNLLRCRLLWPGCEVQSGGLGRICRETLAQSCSVVRVNPRIFRGAGDGDIGKPVVD